MKNFVKFSIVATSIAPLLASANAIETATSYIQAGITNIPAVVIGVAVIYFLVGVYQYASGGDEKTRGDAKMKILYGLIAIFVMTAMWGLIAELRTATGIGEGAKPTYPTI